MWLRVLTAIVLAVVVVALALRFSSVPFFWIGLLWAALLIWLMLAAKRSMVRAVIFNLAVVFAVLAAVEAWLESKRQVSPRRAEGAYTERYFDKARSPVLGYRPYKNTTVDSRRYFRDQLVYDVVYTIDADGLRVAPPVAPGGGQRCILFFGGSFTFGEGVDDNQTAAYRVGERLDGRYRIYNFGFHGYGPHQMLSALRSGLARSIADCDASNVFYQGLLGHVNRSAGLALWDLEGPRFVRTPDGVERDGSLYRNYRLPLSVVRALEKSRIFKRVVSRLNGRATDEDLQLFVAIVDAAREAVGLHYPNASFRVLLWPPMVPTEGPLFEPILVGLRDRGIDVTLIDEVLPGIRTAEGGERYKIARDGHPTVLAQDRISAYIVEHLITE